MPCFISMPGWRRKNSNMRLCPGRTLPVFHTSQTLKGKRQSLPSQPAIRLWGTLIDCFQESAGGSGLVDIKYILGEAHPSSRRSSSISLITPSWMAQERHGWSYRSRAGERIRRIQFLKKHSPRLKLGGCVASV